MAGCVEGRWYPVSCIGNNKLLFSPMHESAQSFMKPINAVGGELNFPSFENMSLNVARIRLQEQLALLYAGKVESRMMEWMERFATVFAQKYPSEGQVGDDGTRAIIQRWNAAETLNERLALLERIQIELNDTQVN